MIIDTTISAMEDQMGKLRHVDEVLDKSEGWNHFAVSYIKKQYRNSAIKDFLIKQGKDPDQSLNHIVFWKNGRIVDVQLLAEPTEEEKIQAKLEEDEKMRVQLRTSEKRMQELLDKFATYIKYASSSRKNPKPSKK